MGGSKGCQDPDQNPPNGRESKLRHTSVPDVSISVSCYLNSRRESHRNGENDRRPTIIDIWVGLNIFMLSMSELITRNIDGVKSMQNVSLADDIRIESTDSFFALISVNLSRVRPPSCERNCAMMLGRD